MASARSVPVRLLQLGCALLAFACGTTSDRPSPTVPAAPVPTPPSAEPHAEPPGEPLADVSGDPLVVRTTPGARSALSEGAALVEADDVAGNPMGEAGVTLARRMVFPPYLWVANHTSHTVSRVSTRTGREEGRYWVGRNPSRTAVDLDGNVWIGGRDDGRLTKILWDTSACPDRDGDGVIRTSTARELGPLNSAERPLDDECVAYSEVPTPEQTSIRGVAAGPDGRVWFGYTAGGVRSIHADTFELGPHVPPDAVPVFRRDGSGAYRPALGGDGEPSTTHGGGVYGLVVDREGFLYASTMTRNTLTRFNTYSQRWDAVFLDTGCGNYGIAIDGSDRVWLGCTDGGVLMFDPSRRTTRRFRVPAAVEPVGGTSTPALLGSDGEARYGFGVTGLAVEPATGDVWASFWQSGITGRLHLSGADLSDSTWTLIATSGGDLRGVGFDHEGFGWTHGTSSDRVWKIDPATNALVPGFEEGVPVGAGSHYTYSDFTGSTGLSFTAPRGTWSFTVRAPEADRPLRAVRWRAAVPPRAVAELRLRPLRGERAGPWIPAPSATGVAAFHPFDGARESSIDVSALDLRAERFEVEVRLSTSGDERPVVTSVDLDFRDGEGAR